MDNSYNNLTYKVCVLMSTYNGEKYLGEQIESIFSQENVEVKLLVRDDASTDNTMKILMEFKKKYDDQIVILKGENNIGWQDSFLTLLFEARKYTYPYYAFSDQDDIWYHDKLKCACERMTNISLEGAIYYSNQMVVDSNGNNLFEIKEYKDWFQKGTAKKRACLDGQTMTLGCVMVFDRKLLEISTENDIQLLLKKEIAHDQWMSMVATYFGEVIYDDRVSIYHRQHVKSITNSGRKKRKHVFRKYKNYGRFFYGFYKDNFMLSDYDKKFLRIIAKRKTLFEKIQLIKDSEFRYDSLLSTIKLRMQILLGMY